MSKILLGMVFGALALFVYQRALDPLPVESAAEELPLEVESSAAGPETSGFRCDGRTHCSQMASCAEATYFLRRCPGVKMDGDRDGIPCEEQHCRN